MKKSEYEILSRRMNNDDIFRNYIVTLTNFLDNDVSNVQRLWHYLNNIYQIPNCKNCNNSVSFSKKAGVDTGYNKYCSNSCKITYINLNRTDEEKKQRNDKIKKTCLKKYGVPHFSNDNVVKQKKVLTYLKKYGVDNPSKSDIIKLKKENTFLERYGVDNPSKLIEIHSKKSLTGKNKIYTSPTGKVYKVEGYEPFILDELFSMGYTDDDIVVSTDIKNKIGIIYYNFNGKTKVYHPDIYIISKNILIDVKSEYWYNRFLDNNLAKQEKCNSMGIPLQFWIYNPKTKTTKIK